MSSANLFSFLMSDNRGCDRGVDTVMNILEEATCTPPFTLHQNTRPQRLACVHFSQDETRWSFVHPRAVFGCWVSQGKRLTWGSVLPAKRCKVDPSEAQCQQQGAGMVYFRSGGHRSLQNIRAAPTHLN